ncbi:MAG: spermidine synthase [Acidiferrobacterales bacterium]
MKGAGIRNLLFLLFAISGFSGLIYESIWTHYLKLFLGHAAYAQSLVLAIFMAGMATGSWIVSRYGATWRNLLLGYAAVEGVIGIMGMLFHNAFVQATDVAYYSILPNVGAIGFAETIKWALAVLLVLPQSILLGMTFPLMSAGLLRWFPQRPGASLAMLYFSNSFGAAIGVLTSGFVLIKWAGLPGTILTAGLINVVLALIVWVLVRGHTPNTERRAMLTPAAARDPGWYTLLLVIALLTGTASFIYEIGWIRMLSLVLGSSTHAFELMLSAFIFGLAFGGLWIRRRIDGFADSVRVLAIVQISMGVLAMSTLAVYGHTFEVMQWTLKVVSKTDGGYTVFNLLSHLVALAVMLPATFCAGMTLPLITYTLLKKGYGERSIGAVYASNTVGAIVGVFAAVHIGMPLLGLKGLIVSGACIDIVLGAFLFWRQSLSLRNHPALIGTMVGAIAIALTLTWVELDAYKMASGVYRFGKILSPQSTEIRYHKDGKTATVDLIAHRRGGNLALRTNGKTDAQITLSLDRPTTGDEPTMVMLGALPLAFHPDAKTAAVIGMGAGLTTHVLLSVPWLARVDTIEIEPAMVEAAHGFRPRVEAAFTDPRSHIYIDDAKTYFAVQGRKYDIIVSEPSNPWVSGTASLFSEEFYTLARRHLKENGLFVQWVQLYEINVELVASVLKALAPHFSDYVVYVPLNRDLVIVAKHSGRISGVDARVLKTAALARSLERIGIKGVQDFELRRLGDKRLLDPLVQSFPVPVNSDYFPFLDLNAAKTRFFGAGADALVELQRAPLPALDMLGGSTRVMGLTRVLERPDLHVTQSTRTAMALRDFFANGSALTQRNIPDAIRRDAELVRLFIDRCKHAGSWTVWLASLHSVAVAMLPYLTPTELERVWDSLGVSRCNSRLEADQRTWIALFKAIGNRDAQTMAHMATDLLRDGGEFELAQFNYLLATGMLGNIVAGSPQQAQTLWGKYAKKVKGRGQPRMLFRLLLAHAANGPVEVARPHD